MSTRTAAFDGIVIGCGVAGLTSAIRLAEAGLRVRIVARAVSPHTTSDIAAAVWYPFRTEQSDRSLAWAVESLAFLRGLADDPGAGVTLVEGIEALPAAAGAPPPWHAAVDGFRRARRDEIPPPYVDGFVFTVPVAQMPVHLAWLAARFRALGGVIETGVELAPDDLDRLAGEAAVVVNCTGLGARDLVGDADLVPIRGQIVRVTPGHAGRFVQAPADEEGAVSYVIPRPDCTVLGGTTELGRWDLDVDPATAEAIRARCVRLVPALADAAVLSHAVGLRPGRPSVRLEAERRAGGWLIHDYGHGGAGVTLAWGCAGEVVRLAETCLGHAR